MRSAGEPAQHPCRIPAVLWFAQNLVVQRDGSIGPQNRQAAELTIASPCGIRRYPRKHRLRLFARQPRHVSDWILVWPRIFCNIGGVHLKLETRLLEQLAPARGGRCKDQHNEIMAAGARPWAVKLNEVACECDEQAPDKV